jgi:hypothetical protein
MRVIGCTTRRPLARHHRKRALFQDGISRPGPNDSAEAIRACKSTFVSAALVVERAGQITGYASALAFFGHATISTRQSIPDGAGFGKAAATSRRLAGRRVIHRFLSAHARLHDWPLNNPLRDRNAFSPHQPCEARRATAASSSRGATAI